jgi:hypothetical protein
MRYVHRLSRLFRLPWAIFQRKALAFPKSQSNFLRDYIFCSAPRYIYESISCQWPHCLSIWRARPCKHKGRELISRHGKSAELLYSARHSAPMDITHSQRRENYFRFFPVVEGPKHFRVTLIIYQHGREQIHSPLITITRKCMQLHATLSPREMVCAAATANLS